MLHYCLGSWVGEQVGWRSWQPCADLRQIPLLPVWHMSMGHLPGLDGKCCDKRAPGSDSTFFCSAGRFCCSWACCSLSSSPCLCCRRTSFTGSCLESWRLPLASVHLSPLFSDPTTHCGPSSGHHWVCTSMRGLSPLSPCHQSCQ